MSRGKSMGPMSQEGRDKLAQSMRESHARRKASGIQPGGGRKPKESAEKKRGRPPGSKKSTPVGEEIATKGKSGNLVEELDLAIQERENRINALQFEK